MPHPTYPRVFVSNLGLVLLRDKRAPVYLINGYWRATLSKKVRVYTHRLVMESFCGVSPCRIRHLDGDKQNSKLHNLAWIRSATSP